MFVDFVLNGQAHGPMGEGLAQVRFDTGLLRPFIDSNGHRCVMMDTGKKVYNHDTGEHETKRQKVLISALQARGINHPVWNSTLLTKDAWIQLDTAIVRAARQRLSAYADLEARGALSGFNAMGKMTLEYQSMNDPGEAIVDMDGITPGRTDRPLFDIKSLPLPITHSDFWFSERDLAVSRSGGVPLDTTMGEAGGRRVGETVERTTIGTEAGVTFGSRSTGPFPLTGSSTVYGYTNYPYRITKTDLNTPTGNNPDAIMQDVNEMLELAYANGFFGPFILYHSTSYSQWLNGDYFRSGSTSAVRTVRERVMELEGISEIKRLDYLTSGYQLLLVQMDPETARAVNGMDITTVAWDTSGGMRKNFKVMCIKVPQLRAKYNGTTGIIHATTS